MEGGKGKEKGNEERVEEEVEEEEEEVVCDVIKVVAVRARSAHITLLTHLSMNIMITTITVTILDFTLIYLHLYDVLSHFASPHLLLSC